MQRKEHYWVSEEVRAKASEIAVGKRLEWLIKSVEQPIPEHKFESLYLYVFNEALPFGPNITTLVELVASTPGIYRKISKDGNQCVLALSDAMPSAPVLNYKPPSWAWKDDKPFPKTVVLSMYKDGSKYKEFNLFEMAKKNNGYYLTIGRFDAAGVMLLHPTISRVHACVQFGTNGNVFLYHLGSAQTILQNRPVPTQQYIELKHKDDIRFGRSSRRFVVNIYDGNDENESNAHNSASAAATTTTTIANKKEMQTDFQNKENELRHLIEQLSVDLKDAKKREKDALEKLEASSVAPTIVNEEKESSENERCDSPQNPKPPNRNRRHKSDKNEATTEESSNSSSDDREEESDGISECSSRVFEINGIDFSQMSQNLSKLTVAKINLYVKKNNLNVGKVRKAELVAIVQKDIQNHI